MLGVLVAGAGAVAFADVTWKCAFSDGTDQSSWSIHARRYDEAGVDLEPAPRGVAAARRASHAATSTPRARQRRSR